MFRHKLLTVLSPSIAYTPEIATSGMSLTHHGDRATSILHVDCCRLARAPGPTIASESITMSGPPSLDLHRRVARRPARSRARHRGRDIRHVRDSHHWGSRSKLFSILKAVPMAPMMAHLY